MMKQNRENGIERVNALGYHGRDHTHDDYRYDEDAYYVNDQTGVSRPTPKISIRILGANVKKIKVGTTIGITN